MKHAREVQILSACMLYHVCHAIHAWSPCR